MSRAEVDEMRRGVKGEEALELEGVREVNVYRVYTGIQVEVRRGIKGRGSFGIRVSEGTGFRGSKA